MKKKGNGPFYHYAKRMIDLFFAMMLSIILSPIMLICYVMVKLTSPGPALFKQRRPGKDGKIFTIYKFRTMRVETECNGVPLSDMARMTRIGRLLRKLSLDELPQIFNILTGSMSFIGPRPLLEEYLPRYTLEQAKRHDVRPGITGWAQVNGRNALTWEQKFQLDIYYVDHMCLALDAKIVWMTIATVLARRGINQGERTTMEVFMGSEDVGL